MENKDLKEKKVVPHTHIYNLGLKRQDGKVEYSTIFRENDFLTRQDIKNIGERFSCDVIVEYIGTVKFAGAENAKEHSLVFKLPPVEAVIDSSKIVHSPDELKEVEKQEEALMDNTLAQSELINE